MADKYYENAKKEFDPLIPELKDAGVINTNEQKEAVEQFLDAAAQNLSTFVNATYTAEHPGETMKEATGSKPLTDIQKAEKNRGITTEMVSSTMATWVRGPSEGLWHEHNLTVKGDMGWALQDAEFRLGKPIYGPQYNPDGTPMLDNQGRPISGDIAAEPQINKQWATDVLKIAQEYVQIQKSAQDKAGELHRAAEIERQHAKDPSFLHAEAQTRNVGARGLGDTTVDMLRKEHLGMAQTNEKQAQAIIDKSQKDAAKLVDTYVHTALHGSALDSDNQQLHHQLPQPQEVDHSQHDHHSNASDAARNPMSVVLQHVASRDPDAALQLAQQIAAANTQATQPAMEQG